MTSCLSFHASYRCRHAGACCAAPWQVKADDHVVAFVSRSPEFAGRTHTLFVEQPSRVGQPAERSVAKGPTGTCVFREDRRCTIHKLGGEEALPVGCRHYPRVARIDPTGIALSLSHYCPTAASLLASEHPVRIVPADAPLTPAGGVDGLDTRDALPPLLKPDMLMDREAYAAWEHEVVHVFATDRADIALRRVARATDTLRRWRPGGVSLASAVAHAFASPDPSTATWLGGGLAIARDLNRGVVALPDAIVTPPEDSASQRILGNYLAARVFGNWIAYQGRGLRTIVAWLAACHDAVCLLSSNAAATRTAGILEAVRLADYVMLHTIDTQAFANAARGLEA